MSTNMYYFKDDLNKTDQTKNLLYLSEECKIPAYSEIITSVNLNINEAKIPENWLCTSSVKMAQRFGVFVANGIVANHQTSKPFLLKLSNLTNKDIILPLKTVVGIGLPIMTKDIEEIKNLNTINDQTQQVFETLNYCDNKLEVSATNQKPILDFGTKDIEFDKLLTDLKLDAAQFSETEFRAIKTLLYKFRDIFVDEPSVTHLTEHKIELNCETPINQAPYRRSLAERKVIKEQIESMIKNKIIQPSRSPWASPVVLIPKPDGTMRFCIDYRKLNNQTIKDVYPLPRIDDSLALLGGNVYFSSLDLAAGYWQIPMADRDKYKTAFITEDGLFEFNVLPFGLNNAPATFQRLMDAVLAGIKWKSLLVYLDDIIVFSSSFDKHLRDLSETFTRIRDANLRLKPSKCKLFTRELKYLGFLVNQAGIKPNPDKVKAITNMPSPKH